MTIQHHLTQRILLAYSAGTLPEAFNLVVAAHVSLCDECRVIAGGFDVVGGALLDAEDTEAMEQGALATALAGLDTRVVQTPEPKTAPQEGAVFPAPLRAYANGDLADVTWRSIGGGIKQAILISSDRGSARLLRIPAGQAVPDHGHRGLEMTLVLRGAFSDEAGRFARGDIELADEDVDHTPTAESGDDCICLAATDAPLRFNAFLPRLVQPFLRI